LSSARMRPYVLVTPSNWNNLEFTTSNVAAGGDPSKNVAVMVMTAAKSRDG
jgi:hypothetical protein